MKKIVLGILLVLFMIIVFACGRTNDVSNYGAVSEGKVSFVSTDINGNEVSSNDLFKDHKLTMVNIWATFCGPCLKEMPELEKLSKKFNQDGYGLVGVIADSSTSLDEAKAIMADMGISYPNVCNNDDIEKAMPTQVVPTTYFVDSEGNIVGSPVFGASEHIEEQYTQALNERLALLK